MKGWGVRPADWQIGVTLQQEILPRVSMEVGYTRRWLQNFTVTDNLAPGAVGLRDRSASRRRSIRGCPAAAATSSPGSTTSIRQRRGVTDNYRTYAPNYGNQYSIYNGSTSTSMRGCATACSCRRAASTGQRVTDNCEVRAKLPADRRSRRAASAAYSSVNPDCHIAPGITTRATAAGSYTIPKIDVLLSGTFQSSPGMPLAANYVVPQRRRRADARPRRCPGTPTNVTVNLLAPGESAASGSTSSTSASARCCASAGSGPPCRSTCSTR